MSLPESVLDHTWIVVPAYQEQKTIGTVVTELRSSYPHVVVVDDGSGDETAAEARSAGAMVLRHIVNRGQGAALQTGLSFSLGAGARYLITFDADGQHRVEDIEALIQPILAGRAEIALGSRFLGSTAEMPFLRRLLLKAAVLFTWATSGLKLTDTHNGLRAFSRAAARPLSIRLDRMAHASELIDKIARSKLPYEEVPVHVRYTPYSKRKGQSTTGALRVLADYLLSKVMD
jgi:glycosyltransferase involved in cell wall biosynthesis